MSPSQIIYTETAPVSIPYRIFCQTAALYKDSLQSYWRDIDHQLCLFHVIKEVNKVILDGVRAIKNSLRRQGNKGRKRRPGRPSDKVQKQRQQNKEMSRKEQATFIWEHQYLIVRKQEEMTDQDKDNLALMFTIAPELELFRRFNSEFYRLFEKGISQHKARVRRTRLVNLPAALPVCRSTGRRRRHGNPDYQANLFLARALKKLSRDRFEKMIVFLSWENVECTNNHVERNNRVFRMLQKTRYKRRRTHTLEKALELDLYARMLKHPLYRQKIKNCPDALKGPPPLKRAA